MEVRSGGGPRPSAVKFVEWSNLVRADAHDVRWLTSRLATTPGLRVLDIGGGSGRFARLLREAAECRVDVVDPCGLARERFVPDEGLRFFQASFDAWQTRARRYDLVVFRTVLHHLVGRSESDTTTAQVEALRKAAALLARDGRVFVMENIYDPLIGNDLSGRLIHAATRLEVAAPLFRRLGANSAGEGVRFRSLAAWRTLIASAGLNPTAECVDPDWGRGLSRLHGAAFLCRRRYQWLALLQAAPRPGVGGPRDGSDPLR